MTFMHIHKHIGPATIAGLLSVLLCLCSVACSNSDESANDSAGDAVLVSEDHAPLDNDQSLSESSVTPGVTPTQTTPSPSAIYEVPDDFITYTDEKAGFNIAYPWQWKTASIAEIASLENKWAIALWKEDLDSVERPDLLLVFGAQWDDWYWPEVSVWRFVYNFSKNYSLHEDKEDVIDRLIEAIYQCDIQETVETYIDGHEALIIEYLYQVDLTWLREIPELENFRFKNPRWKGLRMILAIDDYYWNIDCSYFDKGFQSYEDDFNAIVRSLQIISEGNTTAQ